MDTCTCGHTALWHLDRDGECTRLVSGSYATFDADYCGCPHFTREQR
ncbi:hypothetical protein KNV22_gp06 [Gordonia phage Love]|nr:hypothetical protein FDJ33_gp06 [Gordonia phage Brandonk123]YP_010102834.1 hypothetical protein KNU61_gp06 [Gordonia phage Galadriel]YP_010109841.1 hypothetical protein KNV22_gp06 [Gordonia phage Love]AUX81843.1 hypothetical protein SEA_BRANDONK123_6 [Gordonia phage Brandonk123]QDH92025.1 hypothetical protein SEA_GALADRIEL_6 [Gordonia phage Galadriel]QNJ57726.1 hypothetical protein SEA_LOVE_6 [Gordonia phage Love]